jgi:hypothetical protein
VSAWWWAAVLAAVVVVTLALTCVVRARRLDRLHVRTDAARAGLHSALDRRVAVALRVVQASEPAGGRGAEALRAAAVAARTAPAYERELAENALTRRLAGIDRTGLPAALHEELADAQQLVLLARRVHNDAVRDTLDLRSRRLVRWFRLAGTAPAPAYFEIADPEPPRPDPAGRSPSRSATAPGG